MATRIGVDVGGTFTDLIFYDDRTGKIEVAKEPTTVAAAEEGVVAAVKKAVPPDAFSSTRYFLHGTTSGLNALIERKGAVVGLLTTRGFRDALEIRRGDRDEMYNLFWTPAAPLVPRRLRRPVTERVTADGRVHVPLDEDDIGEALEIFKREGVDCIAVVFINAYANAEHELRAEQSLRRLGFGGDISLSHRVSGEYREYERTCTTVVDAYVRPRMTGYLRRLNERLVSAGLDCEMLVTRSGGGSMTFAEAEERPFETIQSGPVAGVEGVAELARDLELGNVITADVGGTSLDISLITDGRPAVLYEGSVVGLPLQTSWVDVRSIGAGGGSLAHVDVGGLLRVGPESAGADPGPACYGRGGTQPTVTDAAAVLGMLALGELAGGIRLDVERARQALAPLGERLELEIEEVAHGVITIATANMANAIREITIERGHDPREARLVAFGGAGPLFWTLMARQLDVSQVVIPPYAGNFSAWGLLGSDLTRTASRTRIMQLDRDAIVAANAMLSQLFAALDARGGGGLDGGTRREVALDMRYAGQEHTLTVTVPAADGLITANANALYQQFTSDYRRTFDITIEDPVEIVNVRATIRTPLPRRAKELAARRAHGEGRPADSDARPLDTVDAFSFARGEREKFEVFARADLSVGDRLVGPLIVIEETATTYVDAGFLVQVDPSGCLFVSEQGAEGGVGALQSSSQEWS